MRPVDEQKVRFEFIAPLWFMVGLKQLARRERKSMAALVQSAVVVAYPELTEMKGGFVSRVLSAGRKAREAAAAAGAVSETQPGAPTGQ